MSFEHIPERMKQTPHWIVWRLEDRGDPKPNKTPYCVRGGYGKVNDPTTWATFSEAVMAYQSGKFNGIGFVFTGTPFVGVDIDGCIDPGTGEVAPEAIDALNTLRSYTELSQSGKPDWYEPLNLYAVVVALPAERKSALLQAMTRLTGVSIIRG